MAFARHFRTRLALALLIIVAVVATLVALSKWLTKEPSRRTLTWSRAQPQASQSSSPSVGPSEVNSPNPSPSANPNGSPLGNDSPNASGVKDLIIPVAGIRPDQLVDTFSDARDEGRVHDAIDIPAPQGTPVLAAVKGTILRFFHSDRGGQTIYQLSDDRQAVYYYAHLDRYAEGLVAGQVVTQGTTIGYVGDTGNAGKGNYHLHFSIALISDPKRYWEGVNINPYPLLKK